MLVLTNIKARSHVKAKRHHVLKFCSSTFCRKVFDCSCVLLDLVNLDDALAKLQSMDEAAATLVELRFFSGLTIEEIAKLQGVTTRAIEKRWRRTRAWLNRELSVGSGDE